LYYLNYLDYAAMDGGVKHNVSEPMAYNVPSVAEVAEGNLPSAPASQACFNLPESAPPLAGQGASAKRSAGLFTIPARSAAATLCYTPFSPPFFNFLNKFFYGYFKYIG
jgi:hypothetical protein